MPYVMIVVGLLVMSVPDDAGLFRVSIQSAIGLGLFGLGIFSLIEKNR